MHSLLNIVIDKITIQTMHKYHLNFKMYNNEHVTTRGQLFKTGLALTLG